MWEYKISPCHIYFKRTLNAETQNAVVMLPCSICQKIFDVEIQYTTPTHTPPSDTLFRLRDSEYEAAFIHLCQRGSLM